MDERPENPPARSRHGAATGRAEHPPRARGAAYPCRRPRRRRAAGRGCAGDRPHPPDRASHRPRADRGRHRRTHERTGRYAIGRPGAGARARAPVALAAAGRRRSVTAAASAELGDTLFLTVRTGYDTLCVTAGSASIRSRCCRSRSACAGRSASAAQASPSSPRCRRRTREKSSRPTRSDSGLPDRRRDGARPGPAARRWGTYARDRPGAGHEIDLHLDQDPGRTAGRGDDGLRHPKQIGATSRDRGGGCPRRHRARDRGGDTAQLVTTQSIEHVTSCG